MHNENQANNEQICSANLLYLTYTMETLRKPWKRHLVFHATSEFGLQISLN